MAAETIRGINVVIGAETTGLTAALSSVTTESRNIQGELRQVANLLRMDPGNTTLIAQQQQLLANAIAASTTRLETLRGAQEQVNAQFAAGTINEGQYRAFQREVLAAEQAVQRLNTQLSQVQTPAHEAAAAITAMGESMQGAGEKMKTAGEAMTKAVTAPIIAMGAVVAKGVLDSNEATGKLQAQLGITADEATNLGAVAKEVWKNGFGEDIGGATNAIKDIRLNMGGLAGEELRKVAEGALTISDLFEADVKESTAAAGVMMKSFGIDGQTALDLMTTGFQQGGDYSGELIDTLREYSPQFAAMGLSADQMLGILIEGTKAGAWNMDKVGDAMKEFNIRAQDGSKTTAEGFAAIGLEAEEMGAAIAAGGEAGQQAFMATVTALAAMEDPVAQNTAGIALFGTQWEDVRAKVIIAMADGVKGVGDFQGATENAAAAVYNNNPAANLTSAMRNLQEALAPAMSALVSILNDSVIPAVKSLADWFANLSPAGQKTVLVIAGIAAAIGPLIAVIGTIVGAIGTAVTIFGGFSAALAGGATVIAAITAVAPALGAAITLAMGPVGLAIIAIAALVAGGYLLYDYLSDDAIPATQLFGEETSKATEKAVTAYMDLDENATKHLTSLKFNGETISKEMSTELTTTFKGMGVSIKTGLDKHFKEGYETISTFFTNSSAISESEEAKILNTMTIQNGKKKEETDSYVKEITTILTNASNNNVALTEAEQKRIAEIQAIMKTTAVKALSETELESLAILERLKQQSGDISARQAAEVAKNSIEQKDKAIKAANDQYNGVLKEIIKQRDETGSITKEQADKLIVEATRQRDETVNKATEMNDKVVAQAKLQAGKLSELVDWTTGDIKSKWEVFKTDITDLWEQIGKDADTSWNNFKTSIVGVWDELKTTLDTWWDTFTTWLSGWDPWSTVSSIWGEFKASIVGVWASIKDEAIAWGGNIIQGLIDGITGKFEAAKTAMGNLATAIKGSITSAMGIQSPSTVMAGFGVNIGQGLIDGISSTTGAIEEIMSGISESIGGIISGIEQDYSEMEQKLETPITIPAPIQEAPTGYVISGGTGGGINTSGLSGWALTYSNARNAGASDANATSQANAKNGAGGGSNIVDSWNSDSSNSSSSSSSSSSGGGGWSYGSGSGGPMNFAAGGIVTKPTRALIGEAGYPEAVLPLPKLLPMMTDALMGAIKGLSKSSQPVVGGVTIVVQNSGTIVGSKGMDEFARTVSKRISRDYGLATGGAW